MEKPKKIKLNLVDRKLVAIIKSNLHTYNVRFVKSGKFMEVHKSFVKTVYVDQKLKKKTPPEKPGGNQLTFNI